MRQPRCGGMAVARGGSVSIQLAAICLGDLEWPHPRRRARLLSQSVFQHAFRIPVVRGKAQPPQLAAIALALSGVALQVPAVGRFPWVALTLAMTFSLYAVVKKRAPLGARLGLTAETGLLAPVALVWLMVSSPSPAAAFGGSWPHAALVVGSGLATTLPLILFRPCGADHPAHHAWASSNSSAPRCSFSSAGNSTANP